MKLKLSKKWCKDKANKESDLEIGAGRPPIIVKIGNKYFSQSLNKEVTITKEENGWFINEDYVSWSGQGRRFSDTKSIDLTNVPNLQKIKKKRR